MEEIAIFYGIIKGLFGGRVYPDAVPASNNAADSAQWPAMRYTVPSGKVIATNCYQDYSPRVQVDIYANSPEERAEAVKLVMDTINQNDELECQLKTSPIFFMDFDRNKYQATFTYQTN